MTYKLLFVNVGKGDKFPTELHKMDVLTGDYMPMEYLTGSVNEQVNNLIQIVRNDRPDKIIFNKDGFGAMFYGAFMFVSDKQKDVKVDAFGLIEYLTEETE